MGSAAWKWRILRGSLTSRLLLKIFLFALAMALVPFFHIVDVKTIEPHAMNFDECHLSIFPNPYLNYTGFLKFAFPLSFVACKGTENLTLNVFKELMDKNLLDTNARTLCVGEGSTSAVLALQRLGFSEAFGVDKHPFFSLLRKRFVYELDFEDNYFDFVFSRALDRVSVPALLVLEIERVLRPGGTGAVLVGGSKFYLGGLIRSAIPVSSFLKSSNVVDVCGIGSFSLVIFKKRAEDVASIEHYRLPKECPSVTNNKPFIKHMEPLADEKSGPSIAELSYLPKFMNMSSRSRLIYINIGAGEFVDSAITKIFKPFYAMQHRAFHVYVVDHDINALSTYVKKPGINFVYHPSLAGDLATASLSYDEYLAAPPDEEFVFTGWLKTILEGGDFVVVMMNTRVPELKILLELFDSGAICLVDELFLRCFDGVDCPSLFRGLRNSGVFVHRWSGN
ncbi:hypothetical protein NMG60_11033155 [Bertholletia excelsa]